MPRVYREPLLPGLPSVAEVSGEPNLTDAACDRFARDAHQVEIGLDGAILRSPGAGDVSQLPVATAASDLDLPALKNGRPDCYAPAMAWWTAIEPWDRAALLVLNLATIAGLLVEHRRAARAESRAEDAHRLATEAHEWGREQAERARHAAQGEEERRRWCEEIQTQVRDLAEPISVPEGAPHLWLQWGAENRYFRLLEEPGGEALMLFRARDSGW
ncbi:MAG: hypothetical protein WCC48_12255 [Anaeromyxobacteraceae bacterium]